jgi:hypothetical protein
MQTIHDQLGGIMGFQDLGPKIFNKGINVQITNQQV